MIKVNCSNCGNQKEIYPSQTKRDKIFFCNRSCHCSYRNRIDNPSKHRDLSGENNPMWGVHKVSWNKDKKGEMAHNWKGGVHKRKDGYVRVSINGKRYLQHRLVVKDRITDRYQVVHHIDGNRSNNSPSNLMVVKNQAEHARLHKTHATN